MKAPIILLGVTGSIAAYKAADIASQLVKAGCEVHVFLTEAAERFITPLTMHTLSRNEVVLDKPSSQTGWKPLHIALADAASLLLIAPASANILAELAHGLANRPLTEVALATRAPTLIAPAMNGNMWEHPATRENVATLKRRGTSFIGPSEGMLACGYEGIGRLADTSEIVRAACEILGIPRE
jgi:phosphopantothenoylcysteine synthetase/decarboxylase